jgi:Glycosyl hydrolase family 3 N terminal domain
MSPWRAVWLAVPVLLLALCVWASGGAGRDAVAQATLPYQDASLTPEQRADDLLPRMSLEEKVGQMTQINATALQGDPANPWDRGELNDEILDDVLCANLSGSILSGGGASPAVNTPRAWAEMTNRIQEVALGCQPHGIPIIYGIDAVHGHNNVLGATMFPHQFGLGAAYDTGLTRRLGQATAADVRATGIHWNFAPVAACAGAAPMSPSARRRSSRAISWRRRSAGSRVTASPRASPPPRSTSWATRRLTAVATARTPRSPSASYGTSTCRPSSAASTPGPRRSWPTPAR